MLNTNLQTLNCSGNHLTSLPILNTELQKLYCNQNKLTSLPDLNEKLELIYYHSNPIYEIISNVNYVNNIFNEIINDELNILKRKVNKFNNFIHLYHCLKFKKPLRKWLWELVREPNIIKKYHPNYLINNLGEKDDLDEFLEYWISSD